MISKIFERVVNFKLEGQINTQMVEQIQQGIIKAKYYKPVLISVQISSTSGQLVQAKTIANIFKNYSNKTGAPVYCFADSNVLGSSIAILCSGNKCFANKLSVFGDIGYMHKSYGLKQFSKLWNFERKYIHSGTNKVKLNQFEDLKEDDIVWIKNILSDREQDLRQEILMNRQDKFNYKNINDLEQDLWQKSLFLGSHAYNIGLVDKLQSFDELIEERYHDTKIFNAIKPGFFKQQQLKQFGWFQDMYLSEP